MSRNKSKRVRVFLPSSPWALITAGRLAVSVSTMLAVNRLTPMGINHNITDFTSMSINLLLSRLTFNINPYFYTSTIDNPGSDYNSYYYGIRPGLSYKLTEKTSVGAHYGFSL